MVFHHLTFARYKFDASPQPAKQDMVHLYHTELQERHPNDDTKSAYFIEAIINATQHSPNFDYQMYLARSDSGKVVGKFQLLLARQGSADYDTRRHYAPLLIYVLPEYRRQGIAKQIMCYVVEHYADYDIHFIDGYSDTSDGKAFAEHIGAKLAFVEEEKRVQYDALDWDMIQQWRDDGQAGNPNTRIYLYDGLYSDDDTELQRFCDLATAIEESMDHGDTAADPTTITINDVRSSFKREISSGIQPVYMLTVEADGQLTGLTKMKYFQNDPHHLRQGITGVIVSERGRGLGKWLKAEMLLHARIRFTDIVSISTSNGHVNPPMNAINERLGFQLTHARHFYKIPLPDLKAYLGLS